MADRNNLSKVLRFFHLHFLNGSRKKQRENTSAPLAECARAFGASGIQALLQFGQNRRSFAALRMTAGVVFPAVDTERKEGLNGLSPGRTGSPD
jgi:hypothetical protein